MNVSSIFEEFNTIATENGTIEEEDFIFDHIQTRIIFFTLYSTVFCFCSFGNILVILVILMNRRLRSNTNFFLANLAIADFCVGMFCVYQNFLIYIIKSWSLGEFLCKMYLFVQTLSSTASILILVGICIERYFAIIYPILSKRILTPERLKIKILVIWVISICYSSPRFIFGKTIVNIFSNGNGNETICVMNRQKYNSELSDMLHFFLFYCLPMLILTSLYTRIALCLWKSSKQVKKQLDASNGNKNSNRQFTKDRRKFTFEHQNSSNNVLRARRGVIRMLVVVVFSFAVCHLPFHLRKIWQYWSPYYKPQTDFSAILTALTFLTTYLNSAVNPLLYAFLSNNFRREMQVMINCFPGKKKKGLDPNIHMKRRQSSRYTFRTRDFTLTGSHSDNTPQSTPL